MEASTAGAIVHPISAGVLPPAAVWLGNLLLLGLGTLLMLRIRVRLPLLGSLGLGHL